MNKSALVFFAFWTDTKISNCRYVLYVYIRYIETVLSANYSTYMFVRVDIDGFFDSKVRFPAIFAFEKRPRDLWRVNFHPGSLEIDSSTNEFSLF